MLYRKIVLSDTDGMVSMKSTHQFIPRTWNQLVR